VSHLSAIGFDMSLDDLQDWLPVFRAPTSHEFGVAPSDLGAGEGDSQDRMESVAPVAARFDTPHGSYLQWAPGEGVELWIQLNAVQKIVGCSPHFSGQGRMEAAIIETVSTPGRALDGHCFGWAAPREPDNPYSGLHAIAASLPDFAYIDERILIPPVVTLQIAAFASHLEYFPTETAFVESESGQYYAAEIGSSVWCHAERDGLPQPEVYLSGFVVDSEWRANPVTGLGFHALVLRTDAGTIDVVADLETSPRRPVVGTVVAGIFSLSARVTHELPPARKPAVIQRTRPQS
jgi:hypothetical protein